MDNKILLYILFGSLIGLIAGLLLWSLQISSYGPLLELSQNLFFLTGIYFLLKNGSFIRTREFRLLGVSVAILLIGSMFKLMHWPFANWLLLAGAVMVFLIYLLHFLRKPVKGLTDFGKLLFVTTYLTGRWFMVMHWPKGYEITFLSILILILVVISFVREKGILKEVK